MGKLSTLQTLNFVQIKKEFPRKICFNISKMLIRIVVGVLYHKGNVKRQAEFIYNISFVFFN